MGRKNMNIAIVTDYKAPYKGNFFDSLLELEKKVVTSSGKMIYVFPIKAREIEWIQELIRNKHCVEFISEKTTNKGYELKKILKVHGITIVHTHFCLAKTQSMIKIVCRLNRILLIQHFHNHYKICDRGLRLLVVKWSYKGDWSIGCSDSVTESIPYKNKVSLQNAIKFERLNIYDDQYGFMDKTESTVTFMMLGFDYYR